MHLFIYFPLNIILLRLIDDCGTFCIHEILCYLDSKHFNMSTLIYEWFD